MSNKSTEHFFDLYLRSKPVMILGFCLSKPTSPLVVDPFGLENIWNTKITPTKILLIIQSHPTKINTLYII